MAALILMITLMIWCSGCARMIGTIYYDLDYSVKHRKDTIPNTMPFYYKPNTTDTDEH
ncbi:hypothetical protein ES707_06687 [subsurface metagenome]